MARTLSLAVPCGCLWLASLSACAPSATSARSQPLRASGGTTYYHQALAAGPSILTREDGSILDERRDEPFGAAIDSTGPIGARDPHNALNQETDAATGWSDHGARWMAPETGRWLTPDPPVKAPDPAFMAEPWGLHPYQYVGQNPVLFWDPDGRDKAKVEAGSFVISVRRYVPSARFGGGFVGDDRGPSASLDARHRTGLHIAFDPRAQAVTGVSGTSSGIEAAGWFSQQLAKISFVPGPDGAAVLSKPLKSMPDVSASADVVGRIGDRTFIEGQSAASDNLIWIPCPPDIDTQVMFGATVRDGRLVIAGEVTGDPYPALDVVISDAAGNSVLIGGSHALGALGISMLGSGSWNALGTFSAAIDIDRSDTFTGKSSVTYSDDNGAAMAGKFGIQPQQP
jgi:RHS repeat-associated protein